MGMKKKRRDEVEYRKLNDIILSLYFMHASANILPYLYTNAIRMLMRHNNPTTKIIINITPLDDKTVIYNKINRC